MSEQSGKVFHALRKSKHFSMTDLSDEEISQSQISRFERGESNLTIDKFLKLLSNMSVTLDEFQSISDNFSLSEEDQFRAELAHAYETQNAAQLRRMLKILEDKSKKDPAKKYLSVNSIIIKAVLALVVNFSLPKEDIEFVQNYLMTVEDWGRYELWAFSNTIQLFNDSTLNLLASSILQKTAFYQDISENRRLIIRIILNLISLWIQRENFRLAFRYIRTLDKMDITIDFLYEKLMLRYNKGFYRYKNGDIQGLEIMKECNDILGTLGCFQDENPLNESHGEM